MIFAAFSRSRMKSLRADQPDSVIDEVSVAVREPSDKNVFSPSVPLPPPGTCTASAGSYQADTSVSLSLNAIAVPDGRPLDAGPELTMVAEGRNGKLEIGQIWRETGQYRERGGTGLGTKRGLNRLFVDPGAYRLESAGGQDTGPLSMALSLAPPFEWIDRDRTLTINRSSGVTVTWKNAAKDQLILILARNVDKLTTAIGVCLCTARGDAGRFTIPAAMLANVPASIVAPGQRFDKLVLGSISAKPAALQAKGLDGAIVFTVYDTGRFVEYR